MYSGIYRLKETTTKKVPDTFVILIEVPE